MVTFVLIITHKGVPYSSYQGQSIFLILKLQMWESVRGVWNTTDLLYNVVTINSRSTLPM